MNDHKVDEQLKRFSSAVAHATPDPLPLSETLSTRRFKKPVLAFASAFAVVMLAVGLVALGVTWIGSLESSQETVASSDTTHVATSDVTDVALVPYLSDSPLLYHPTILPLGWKACRVLDDPSMGDRFCDPSDPESWIQVRLVPNDAVRADGSPPTGDEEQGVWLERGELNEAAYQRGAAFVLVANYDTLAKERLISIAASIPFVASYGDLYGFPESRLDLDQVSDQEIGTLFELDTEPNVIRRTGEIDVYTSEYHLYGFWGDWIDLADLVYTIPRPRLMSTDRPVLIGESQEQGRGYALWNQGGFVWRVEGQMTGDAAATLATFLIEQISEVP